MRRNILRVTISLALLLVVLVACTAPPGDEPVAGAGVDPTPTEAPDEPVSSEDPTATPVPEEGEDDATGDEEVLVQDAVVTGLEVMMLESWPLQARVQIDGELGDGCTELMPITTEREGETFYVTVKTTRPADAVCTMELRFFSESVALDIEGLEAGTYTVDVNGVTETFTLEQDNVMQPDPDVEEPTEEPAGEEAGEGIAISAEDQAELIRLTLERALIEQEIPDYALLADQETIILSSENIDAALVPEFSEVPLEIMTPEEIQARADAEGDFPYLFFEAIEPTSADTATVSLSSRWAIGADSEMLYLSGGGFEIEYNKLGDSWVGEVLSSWIS